MDVYLEIGPKKTFAVAVDWPGWARAGRDESAAIATLLAYGKRYRQSLGLRAPALVVPESVRELSVFERLDGDANTDFGVPHQVPGADKESTDAAELERLIDLLRRCWTAFDKAATQAIGDELAPAGPRGGGRSLEKMRVHVAEADSAYIGALGGRIKQTAPWSEIQAAFIDALGARARGAVPDVGPRGGRRWPVRYAIRRSAWHALDHAWELEDRLTLAHTED